MGVVEPVTVWAVLEGAWTSEAKGKLSLDEQAGVLSFRHHKGVRNFDLPVASIRRVRRLLASPTLEVEFVRDDDPVRAAFFFAQPPPKPEPERGKGRGQKRRNITLLMGESATKRSVVKAWRAAVRQAMANANG
jgi:hypothetical protein